MYSCIRRLSIFILPLLLAIDAFADELNIYFIDVEQADAMLIVAPSGRSLLIDSGKNGMGSRIKSVMDNAGITKITHFMTTHYHEDHYGGIDDLASSGVTIHNAYDRGDKAFLPASKLNQTTYKDYQKVVGEDATHLTRGETINLDDNIFVTTISSGGVVLGEEHPTVHGDEENNMSISLLINFEGAQIFVGGDIEKETEEKIVALGLVNNIDIYQSNHHVSHSSSSEDFMKAMSPSLIVISNGSVRKYQHPHKTTLKTYSELDSNPLVLQTNKYTKGSSKFGNVADEFIADLPPNDKNGTIKAVIDSETRQIAVSYRDQSHTIPLKNTAPSSSSCIVIEKLLPDPAGRDINRESVTLKNKSTETIAPESFRLIDASGRLWVLEGELGASQSREIRREVMPMSLNNNGDTIHIIDLAGNEIDRFTYAHTNRGQEIITGH